MNTTLVWNEGYPAKPWADEWFIAQTVYGDRVVLTALPEEYTYDFKTADDTYIKKEKIKRWMQFPDSEYIPPTILDKSLGQYAYENALDLPCGLRFNSPWEELDPLRKEGWSELAQKVMDKSQAKRSQ